MKGKVKFFNDSRGYGFIYGDDGTNYFIHVSNCKDTLTRGDAVVFDTGENNKGNYAYNVRFDRRSSRNDYTNLGGDRIRIGDIKRYGIQTWEEEYQHDYTPSEQSRANIKFDKEHPHQDGLNVAGKIGGALLFPVALANYLLTGGGTDALSYSAVMMDGDHPPTSEQRKKERAKLVVETIHNGDYTFYDEDYDIYKMQKNLDVIFGVSEE